MRNIETFSSKQMYPYLSLDERKVAEFYHNIDRRGWLVCVKMTFFHRFFRTIPGVLVISVYNFRVSTGADLLVYNAKFFVALFNKFHRKLSYKTRKSRRKFLCARLLKLAICWCCLPILPPPSPPRIHPIAIWATASTYWYNGMGIVKISYWYLNDMGSYHILCMSGLKDLESSLRVCSRVASSSYLKIKIEQYQLFGQMHHKAASIFETYDSTPVAN